MLIEHALTIRSSVIGYCGSGGEGRRGTSQLIESECSVTGCAAAKWPHCVRRQSRERESGQQREQGARSMLWWQWADCLDNRGHSEALCPVRDHLFKCQNVAHSHKRPEQDNWKLLLHLIGS